MKWEIVADKDSSLHHVHEGHRVHPPMDEFRALRYVQQRMTASDTAVAIAKDGYRTRITRSTRSIS